MKFAVAWRDRGHGHGDYGILDENGILIAKVVSGAGEHARLFAASSSLLEGCKKALTCASLNSDVRLVIEAAIAETKLCNLMNCECPCHFGGLDSEGVCKQPCERCDK